MSYQVLARKWRPRNFTEMVGQEHVLKALINALENGRLHHAYLFTGTRGVGKTTIARILAKSLNCELGITSKPCGECSACREIDEGRFVDLIEVDAASRTKVEDTRELLDNVQYAPTRGRFKVYLIDEVHMLSGHSFNALLKTLEEPPPHVKFLLATTDPQKLPITILSRCLQFSLKAMTPERIVGHLKHVLEQESVTYEEPALWQLGRAADGSMRDAMSLSDQAISFGDGKVCDVDVRAMLGSIDREYVFQLLHALATHDGATLLKSIADMAEQSPDYGGVLADLLSTLHRIAVAQVAPDAVDDSDGEREHIVSMATQFTAEDIQLFYQTALLGRKDLPLAPDARGGFEMILMRMLLFKPQGVFDRAQPAGSNRQTPAGVANPKKPEPSNAAAPVRSLGGGQGAMRSARAQLDSIVCHEQDQGSVVVAQVQSAQASTANVINLEQHKQTSSEQNPKAALSQDSLSKPAVESELADVSESLRETEPDVPKQSQSGRFEGSAPKPKSEMASDDSVSPQDANEPTDTEVSASAAASEQAPGAQIPLNDPWADLIRILDANGSVLNFARNCALESEEGNVWNLFLSPKHEALYQPAHLERLEAAISEVKGVSVKLKLEVREPTRDTPDRLLAKRRRARLDRAENELKSDPFVQILETRFGATMDRESITPIGGEI